MQHAINPWASAQTTDYQRIFSEFGIEPIEPLVERLPKVPPFIERGIVIGHRGYEQIVEAMQQRRRFYVMTGFMPSGHPHLGHLMVMREVVWHVEQGALGYIAIADREAHAVRGISWEDCARYGREYLECLYALGFRGTTYYQSRNNRLKDLAFEAAIKVNFSDLSAIYGFGLDTSLAHAMSVITQVADILFPQLDAGPGPTVVPVGVDQDPHLRLTRDVAFKLRMFTVEDRGEYISVRSKNAPPLALKDIACRFSRAKRYEGHVDLYGEDIRKVQDVVREVEICHGGTGFYTPSSTYHTFMPGLQGGKMSSSVPASLFSFDEAEAAVKKKVMSAITGGRTTLEEQKKMGGEPERCAIFQLNLFHMLPDDAALAELRKACLAGEVVCGRCKKETAERVANFLKEFREKRSAVAHEVGP